MLYVALEFANLGLSSFETSLVKSVVNLCADADAYEVMLMLLAVGFFVFSFFFFCFVKTVAEESLLMGKVLCSSALHQFYFLIVHKCWRYQALTHHSSSALKTLNQEDFYPTIVQRHKIDTLATCLRCFKHA